MGTKLYGLAGEGIHVKIEQHRIKNTISYLQLFKNRCYRLTIVWSEVAGLGSIRSVVP